MLCLCQLFLWFSSCYSFPGDFFRDICFRIFCVFLRFFSFLGEVTEVFHVVVIFQRAPRQEPCVLGAGDVRTSRNSVFLRFLFFF